MTYLITNVIKKKKIERVKEKKIKGTINKSLAKRRNI